jgi:hypothetical protein
MFTYTVEYKDFNEVPKKKELYFNLTEPEIVMWQGANDGALDTVLQRMVDAQDFRDIAEMFDDIVNRSYGVKSVDGEDFDKSEEIVKKFKSSRAYEAFFRAITSDADLALRWLRGMMPQRYQEAIKEEELQQKVKEALPKA